MTDAPSRVRLWVDTDVGGDPDDAVALALAVHHPQVELVGVSTVLGDVEARARVARELLAALGYAVPVHAGLAPAGALESADALLAIGPFTNVARLVESNAPIPARVAVMGGLLAPTFHRGERHEVDFNVACDTDAAAIVFERVPAAVIVPLDVTARLVLDDRATSALYEAAPPLRASIERWTSNGNPLCLHDPLALLALLGDAPVTISRLRLAFDRYGRTLQTAEGTPHDVVTDVDVQLAIDRMLQLLGVQPEGD